MVSTSMAFGFTAALSDRATAMASLEIPPNSLPDSGQSLAAISTVVPSMAALAATASLAGSDGLGQTSALHSDDLSLSALGPRESEALREQVVAGVAGLHVDNVTGMAQVGHGLGRE